MARTKAPITDAASIELAASLNGSIGQMAEARSKISAAATDLEKLTMKLLTPAEAARVDASSVGLPIEEGERIEKALGDIDQLIEQGKSVGKLAKEFQTQTEKVRFAVAKVYGEIMVRADRERERLRREENERFERKRREELERQQTMFNPSQVLPS